jgi:indolepyruvate ferredoxin oxidoreductase
MAGIGGTGVVTAAQILATAAMFDGWDVRGLDQTGLSQKAGPVVSDVVLSHAGVGSSNVVGAGQADVLIGFDGLVAASDETLRAADPQSTVVVASTHRTPTGRMVTHPDLAYPTDAIRARLDARSRRVDNRYLDAAALAERLAGSSAAANILLLGVAVQAGLLPVTPASVARAIDLNGVAVDRNLGAFDWGRRWAHDPAAVEALAATGGQVDPAAGAAPPTDIVTVPDLPPALASRVDALTEDAVLGDVLRLLTADLVGYQDERYATAFLDAVARAVAAEQAVAPGSQRLAETVARSLHKLMAYKDEYEVARLMLLPEGRAAVARAGGAGARVTWQLHPPVLRALGRSSKVAFGPRSAPVFAALARGKRLRGTRLDPFGRTRLRATERALPGEFLTAMDRVYAALPDHVRGYESLKERRVEEYRTMLRDALGGFGASAVAAGP